MAHKKGVGSSKNGREGENVYMGKDHTLHAKVDGVVEFRKKRNNRSYVSVTPFEA